VLIISSITFFLSSTSEMFIKIPKLHKSPEKINLKVFKDDLVEGIGILKKNKLISTIISSGGILNFCVSPLVSIGLVFIMKEVLEVSDMKFGISQMILAASFILAPFIGGRKIREVKVNKLLYYSFISIAIMVLVMAIIPLNLFQSNMIPYIGLTITSFSMGLFATFANIALGTFFDQIVPLELMGRVSTIMSLAMTTLIPIGQMIFGYLYDKIMPNYVIGISGIILLIATLWHKDALLDYKEEKEDGGDINTDEEIGERRDEFQVLPERE